MKIFALAVIVLALGVTAKADTIDYAGAGNIASHTAGDMGKLAAGSSFTMFDELMEIDDQTTGKIARGDLGKVTIKTGTLSSCQTGLCFARGELDITSSGGSVIFDGALTNGQIRQSQGNIFLTADDTGGGTVAIQNKAGDFSSDSIVKTSISTVPEPGALWLLGSGLVGLSFVRRLIH